MLVCFKRRQERPDKGAEGESGNESWINAVKLSGKRTAAGETSGETSNLRSPKGQPTKTGDLSGERTEGANLKEQEVSPLFAW